MPARSSSPRALEQAGGVAVDFPDLTDEIAEIVAESMDSAIDAYGLADVVNAEKLAELAVTIAEKRAAELVTKVSETDRENMNEEIADAVEERISDAELADRLVDDFGLSDERAATIARTELTDAWNAGFVALAKDVGEEYVYATDGTGCDACAAVADDPIWTVEEAEDNPLEHPNCDREFRFLTPEEKADMDEEDVADEEETDADFGISARMARTEEEFARFAARWWAENGPERGRFWAEDTERDYHGRWAKGAAEEKAKLEEHLVDYKPGERALTGPDSKPITEVVKGSSATTYLSVPGIEEMHDEMLLHPTLDTPPRTYVAARDRLFEKQPLQEVRVKDLTFTQPRINVPRARDVIDKPRQLELPVQVLRSNGKDYLMNGHHRVAAAAMAGKTHVRAHVYDPFARRLSHDQIAALRLVASIQPDSFLGRVLSFDADLNEANFWAENTPRGYHGRWGEGSSSTEKKLSDRAARAKASHKPMTKAKEKIATANEWKIAEMVRGEHTDDNFTVDVILKSGQRTDGLEVKSIIKGEIDKVTIHPDSRIRKEEWAKENKATVHVIAVDVRHGRFDVYYGRGAHSFRLGGMTKVRGAGHLLRLIRSKKAA